MPDDELPLMPSLELLLTQVASERDTLNGHVDSIDGKAAVALGFSGVLVGLGATAVAAISNTVVFQVGLVFAIVAAGTAAGSFFPRGYPVLQAGRMRANLTVPADETRLELLDTQIEIVNEVTALLERKGILVRLSMLALALAAFLIVLGTLLAGGPHHG